MKSHIDKLFLEEACPFTQRRKVRWRRLKLTAFALIGAGVLSLLLFTPNQEPSEKVPSQAFVAGQDLGAAPLSPTQENISHALETNSPSLQRAEGGNSRQLTASQIVRRGNGSSSEEAIPISTTISVRLINTVLSSNNGTPLISEIADDVLWKGTVIIPSRTRAIGQATLDDSSERLQGRFHTLVYPEGEQHNVTAIALSNDGSSGILGNYHSQKLKKESGRMTGNFLGGLAQGLTDKDSRGQAGIIFEPGSLKNGILNGVANSSLEFAKSEAGESEGLRPYVEVPAGTTFLLYLEKEYSL